MAQESYQERTEKATPKRRQEARKKGQVAQSREAASAAILLMGLGVFFFAGRWMMISMTEVTVAMLDRIGDGSVEGIADAASLFAEILASFVKITLPVMTVVFLVAIAVSLMQTGFLLTAEPLIPKLSKINPLQGIQRMFSLKSLVELAKSLCKIFLVGGVAYLLIRGELDKIPGLALLAVPDIFVFTFRVAFKIALNVCLLLVLLAVLDYAYQRWEHEKNLKMTRQEVKDEQKQTLGDPKVKSRIRSIQMEMARRRMMSAVPEADVVITNPTHLAVALRFDARNMIAPRVVAKGAGRVAERIKAVAAANDVPVVENKPLARSLFKMVDIDEIIPAELYRAVAEVLAYVYRLRGSRPDFS